MPRGRKPSVSVEGAFRSMIRSEIEQQLQPLQDAVRQLQSRSEDLAALSNLVHQLSPLTQLLAPFAGAPPARRGRPPGTAASAKRGPRRTGAEGSRACAIIGCKRPARSKGYCAAHYQKLRMLTRTHRKPGAWTEFAAPNSVPDVVLPRGRAAHKTRKQA